MQLDNADVFHPNLEGGTGNMLSVWQDILVIFLITVLASYAVNSLLMYFLAKKFASDPSEVTLLGAFGVAFLLFLIWIGSLAVGGFFIAIPRIFLGNLVSWLALPIATFYFFKWGTRCLRSSFEMGGSANTLLVLYLITSYAAGFVVDHFASEALRAKFAEYEPEIASGVYETGPGGKLQSFDGVDVEDMTPEERDEAEEDFARMRGNFSPVQPASQPSASFEPTLTTAEPAPSPMVTPAETAPPAPAATPAQPSLASLASVLKQVSPEEKATQLQNQASTLWQQAKYPEALQAAEQALKIYQSYLPANDPKILNVQKMIEAARKQLLSPTPTAN